jgi:hypothetical protein
VADAVHGEQRVLDDILGRFLGPGPPAGNSPREWNDRSQEQAIGRRVTALCVGEKFAPAIVRRDAAAVGQTSLPLTYVT